MKIKVSPFNGVLVKQYLELISVVSIFLSFFAVVIDIPKGGEIYFIISIALFLILFYVILWCIVNFRTSRRFNINGSPLEVKIGDIFEESELRTINFNEYFDTIVDDSLISRQSLNDKFLDNKVSNITALDNSIKNDKHLTEMRVDEESNRLVGKKIRYKLGSIHVYKNYLLVAFSRFDKENKAFLSIRDYINCLMTFWEEVDRVYAGKSVAVPLMGSGITRFKDAQVSEQELLEILIWSFKVSRVKFRYPAKVTIVIHKSMKDKINFYNLKG